MTEPPPWSRRVTSAIGQQVKRYRDSLKLSARELADLTENLGHKVEYNVIANMETGRRTNISVAELLVLATALQVPALLLIAPVGQQQDVERVPGALEDPWKVYTVLDGTATSHDEPFRSMIDTYRRHDEAARLFLDKLTRVSSEMNGTLDALVNVRAHIRSKGWRLPLFPPTQMALTEEIARTAQAELEKAETRRGIGQ